MYRHWLLGYAAVLAITFISCESTRPTPISIPFPSPTHAPESTLIPATATPPSPTPAPSPELPPTATATPPALPCPTFHPNPYSCADTLTYAGAPNRNVYSRRCTGYPRRYRYGNTLADTTSPYDTDGHANPCLQRGEQPLPGLQRQHPL